MAFHRGSLMVFILFPLQMLSHTQLRSFHAAKLVSSLFFPTSLVLSAWSLNIKEFSSLNVLLSSTSV